MTVPLIAGAARAGATTAARSGLIQSAKAALTRPAGAATAGFFAGDFLGGLTGGTPARSLGERFSSLAKPSGLVLFVGLALAVYVIVESGALEGIFQGKLS